MVINISKWLYLRGIFSNIKLFLRFEFVMEEVTPTPTFGATHATAPSAEESDNFVVFALLICFTLVLFVAFR